MEKTLISVIVPVYNVSQYLERCLNSIIAQTHKNIEVILIDDGSTDGSAEICDRYEEKDARFRVIHKKNGGVSKARNTGLEIVKGKYIGFVDSDDTIEPDMYEMLHNALNENDADMAICNQTKITLEEKVLNSKLEKLTVFNKNQAIEEVLLGRAFVGGPCNKLFKAELCKDLFFDEDIFYGEDLLFVVKNLLRCDKIVCTPESYYNYYIRDGSACTSSFSEKTFTDHISRERIFEFLEQTEENKLIELGHIAFLLCDIALLGKLYYDKSSRKEYCKIIQKSIRKHFSVNRLKPVSLFQKIGIIAGFISINLYFVLFPVQIKIKQIKCD